MRPGNLTAYGPDVGDIIWLDFLQSIANEQAGRRPALVLSPRVFNELTGQCVACPITRRDRGVSMLPLPASTMSKASFKPISCAACPGKSADHVLSAGRPRL
jgi:mRNA-degrading endonuclease toxin of MazEF toxin-antitoxin module